ncbi:MAG: hypothetical protein A3H44_07855 [Gammaproteobacteria bacterium RIFCSPLOWO2_02_FULL_57_10]|nr:MAG: hypothetical protein A3H44_07855 [Gammaproteobacteria bacterium RIFCSPLOWO2_02_FULL_57_10]
MMKTTLILAFLFGLSVSTQALANDAYLLRQASELEAISYNIARELRHTGGYGYLRDDAENLAREARRFRDSLSGSHDRRYVQTRYDEMSRYYDRFERRYRQTSFGHNHRHVHNSYVSITTVFGGISGGYLSYSRGYVEPRRNHDRVIIYQSPSIRYAPFGIQHDSRRYDNDRYDNRRFDNNRNRHDRDRHDNRRNDHRDDRGRRNHYK